MSAVAIGPDDFDLPPASAYREEPISRKADGGTENTRFPSVAESASFAAFRLDQIDVKPRTAIVQGLGFDHGAVGAIVGSPNAGKTAFAISLALAVAARAEQWLGLKIAGGPVLYFGAEAPGSVVMRARAASRRMDYLQPSFYMSSAVPGLGGQLSATSDADRVIATVRRIETDEGEAIRLVCIDTLAACLADGDENADGMLRLVSGAKRIALFTGALVLLIHHPSKGDLTGLRGHGSLAAACDSILRIETDGNSGVRTATLVKARDAATGLQLRFELEPLVLEESDSFGDPLSTIVVRATNQPTPRPRPAGQRQQQLLAELERRYRIGERNWDEATIRKAGRDLGMHRNSHADALRGLAKGGYVTGTAASLALRYPPQDVT